MVKYLKLCLVALISNALIVSGPSVWAASDKEMEELKMQVRFLTERLKEVEQRLDVYESQDRHRSNQVSDVNDQVERLADDIQDIKRNEGSSDGIVADVDSIDINLGATFVYQGTSKANGGSLSSSGEDTGDGGYSIDLELSKEFGDNASAYMLVETGDGAGVDDDLKLFSGVNADADDSDNALSVSELWYEHNVDAITMTFGKLDPTIYIDTNEYANDEATQFLGSIFRNNPTIEFADNAGGFRLGVEANDMIDVNLLAIDGDSDFDKLFDDMFVAGQVNIKPNLLEKEGNYRLIGWFSNRNHTKHLDTTQTEEDAFGFAVSIDQQVTDKISMFARYGWQDEEVFLRGEDFSLSHSYSIGLQLNGETWHRGDDIIGLAFGQVFPSDDYKDAGSGLEADPESHLELYYNYKVNEHLSISPDLQVIWNPFGGDAANGDETIVIGGVRAQFDFN